MSCHLAWAPKYCKWILGGEIRQRVRRLFEEIAQAAGILKAVSALIYVRSFPKQLRLV
jgi:REP element-mobilizing transposase RayT